MPDKNDHEVEKRRDDALRRALTTPYKPQDALKKTNEKPQKPTTGKGRARVGKAR